MNGMTANAYEKNDKSGVVLCHICYGLYALGMISFITSIIGVIINYITRRGTTSELLSHHNWMIKTFWISIISLTIIIIVPILIASFLTPSIARVVVAIVGLPFLVWYIYRIVKGWRRLCQRKSIG